VRSALCTEAQLTSDAFVAWADRIRPAWDLEHSGVAVGMHRKIWEWLFIIEALHQLDMLRPGRRGLGFGVGRDPLAAFFASLGCTIVATDLEEAEAAAAGWTDTGQHASGLAALNTAGLCDPEAFAERVSFRVVDMNDIPADLRGFDFVWSACAFEHLGSLARGERFVVEAMRCVRPGGVAVHTTEFNVGSNSGTVVAGPTVLFRRRDIERLVRALRRRGNVVEPVDFDTGAAPADQHVDVPPWSGTHLKLEIERFVSTSIALVVKKQRERNVPSLPVAARDVWARVSQRFHAQPTSPA
jgi:SAM-dependent methyltransferase